MFIDGFGISSYRSFNTLQNIGPCSAVNIIIGENNCGKSNVLRFIQDIYTKSHNAMTDQLFFGDSSFVFHIGANEKALLSLSSCLVRDSSAYTKFLSKLKSSIHNIDVEGFLDAALFQDRGFLWVEFEAAQTVNARIKRRVLQECIGPEIYNGSVGRDIWASISYHYCGRNAGNTIDNVSSVLQKLIKESRRQVEVYTVPSPRELNKSTNAQSNIIDGSGINKNLQILANPLKHDRKESKPKFKAIQKFMREVLECPDALIEIPHDAKDILVSLDGEGGEYHSIKDLGTGIHEVLIIAAAAVLNSGVVMCIEEPEVHLHPLLQKKLLRYLSEETDNQYFIATHSASLIDTPNASVFHVSMEGEQSVVRKVVSSNEQLNLLGELGYKASDLLQANCVIWVEGPTDRLFLNNWVRQVAPELSEGIEYSIMFYGGAVLSHVTALDNIEVSDVEDAEIEFLKNFSSLRRVNQNLAIVMDSDLNNDSEKINAQKKRLINEIKQNSGYAWVTKGREIENYVEPEVYVKACMDVNKNYSSPAAKKISSPYADLTKYKPKTVQKKRILGVDKVKVTRKLVESDLSLNVLDLEKRVNELVRFIRVANGYKKDPA